MQLHFHFHHIDIPIVTDSFCLYEIVKTVKWESKASILCYVYDIFRQDRVPILAGCGLLLIAAAAALSRRAAELSDWAVTMFSLEMVVVRIPDWIL